MTVVECKQRLVAFYNDTDILVFVIENGVVVKSTQQAYVGWPEDEARCAAYSVMRWWYEPVKDNEYPSSLEIRPTISQPTP